MFGRLSSLLSVVLRHPLNRDRRWRAVGRLLAWQIGSRLVPGRVVHPWVGGTRFIVGPGETGLTGNVYCGLHEFADMAFVLHAVRADDLFVDIGANVGSYTLLACGARRACGRAFEPVPATYDRLLDNLRLNDLLGRVEARRCGIADRSADLRFTAGRNCMNRMLVGDEHEAGEILVPVEPLDAALAGARPAFIKIDVEGVEPLVLRGAQATLRQAELLAVIVELNGNGTRYGFTTMEVEQPLRDAGFTAVSYDPMRRHLEEMPAGAVHGRGNTIFVRDLAAVRDRIRTAERIDVEGRQL